MSLLLPAACAGCSLPLSDPKEKPLCSACRGELPVSTRSLREYGKKRFFDQAVSPCLYEGLAKKLILDFKYGGQISLAAFLADSMRQALQRHLGNKVPDAVVPVPLHPTRLRERSFNQAQLLAVNIARELGVPCFSKLLVRVAAAPAQTQCPPSQRAENVRNAFAIKGTIPIQNGRLLLVDDVITTGATANACAKVLKRAGAKSVVVVTFAHG